MEHPPTRQQRGLCPLITQVHYNTLLTGLRHQKRWSVSKLTTPRLSPGRQNDLNMQKGGVRSSALLIFLVTCLILCLMVVVIFIGIKLRKAHITWKKGEHFTPHIMCSLGNRMRVTSYCCNFLYCKTKHSVVGLTQKHPVNGLNCDANISQFLLLQKMRSPFHQWRAANPNQARRRAAPPKDKGEEVSGDAALCSLSV